jgi:hypothetical protein
VHSHATSSLWPEDPAFQTFARKVADGVLWAINTGQRISDLRTELKHSLPNNCMCPLGATLIKDDPRASSHPGAPRFVAALSRRMALWDSTTALPDERMVWAFIRGFEHGEPSVSSVTAVEASGRLGVVYRRLYLGKREARREGPRRKRHP